MLEQIVECVTREKDIMESLILNKSKMSRESKEEVKKELTQQMNDMLNEIKFHRSNINDLYNQAMAEAEKTERYYNDIYQKMAQKYKENIINFIPKNTNNISLRETNEPENINYNFIKSGNDNFNQSMEKVDDTNAKIEKLKQQKFKLCELRERCLFEIDDGKKNNNEEKVIENKEKTQKISNKIDVIENTLEKIELLANREREIEEAINENLFSIYQEKSETVKKKLSQQTDDMRDEIQSVRNEIDKAFNFAMEEAEKAEDYYYNDKNQEEFQTFNNKKNIKRSIPENQYNINLGLNNENENMIFSENDNNYEGGNDIINKIKGDVEDSEKKVEEINQQIIMLGNLKEKYLNGIDAENRKNNEKGAVKYKEKLGETARKMEIMIKMLNEISGLKEKEKKIAQAIINTQDRLEYKSNQNNEEELLGEIDKLNEANNEVKYRIDEIFNQAMQEIYEKNSK